MATTYAPRITIAEKLDLAPLGFASSEEAPQFIGAIEQFVAAYIAATGDGGIISAKVAPAEFGEVSSEGTSLETLVDIRNVSIAS